MWVKLLQAFYLLQIYPLHTPAKHNPALDFKWRDGPTEKKRKLLFARRQVVSFFPSVKKTTAFPSISRVRDTDVVKSYGTEGEMLWVSL